MPNLSLMDRDHVVGQAPVRVEPRRKQYAAGRRCVEFQCETILSIYNKNSTCWAHMPTRYILSRGKRARRASA